MGTRRGNDHATPCCCAFYATAPTHHDQLLAVESASFDAITALVEIAATWHELDYSEHELIDPADWPAFADAHRWLDRDRVLDFFLAVCSVGESAAGHRLAVVVPIRDEEEELGEPGTLTDGDRPRAQLS